jgi:hypothetical protein
MTKKYTLTLTEEQAGILVDALDLYSRIGIGQFEECVRVFDHALELPIETRDACKASLDHAKFVIAGLPSGGSHGIHNPKVRDAFRVAYDIQQVVRHRIAWDRNPEGNRSLVHFDEPRQISKHPLATIKSEP